MSARREASRPPLIPGYEHERLLGMGGFADVFLYRQLMPRRQVAVKVLLASSLDDSARARFRTEADLMASLSHHPSIVTVHHADVASDGRPYLVMEYCSRPGLGQRYRAERISVAEVLRIGVRLASAVETAHRAGILHRDIKPANVLITDFGWPALTDFGIAATVGLAAGAAVGMSIPWSPPELLAELPHGDERSDVYSLAATVYSLLARRSPFEVPDGSNTAADLIARIEHAPLAPTGRGDVPDSLQAVLARAMDRDPERRHHSALALARALQQVEAELLLPLTPLDLPEDVALPREPGTGDDEASQETRLRPVRTLTPDAPGLDSSRAEAPAPGEAAPAGWQPPASPVPGAAPTASGEVPAVVGSPFGTDLPDDVPDVWRRDAEELAAARPRPATRARRVGRVLVAGVAGAAVVTAVAIAAITAGDDGSAATPTPTATPTVVAERAVPTPTDLQGVAHADGTVTFTWTNPEPQEGDRYLWGVTASGTETVLEPVDLPTVTLTPPVPGEEVCVEVSLVRADRRYSTQPAVGCVQP